MSGLNQAALRAAWLDAPCGCLSAWSQARAWALRKCWREEKDSEYGMLAFIAGKITKSGGGHPSPQALGQFFAKTDADASWFPGKLEGEPWGRKRGLSKTQEASIARSAMAMKANNVEPTYTRLLAGFCPYPALLCVVEALPNRCPSPSQGRAQTLSKPCRSCAFLRPSWAVAWQVAQSIVAKLRLRMDYV